MYREVYADADATVPETELDYSYYKNGLLSEIIVDGGSIVYTYDACGNVLTESEDWTNRTYTYDSRGRKSSYTRMEYYPEASTATYAYDDLNRLVSVTEGGITTTYTYDANGNRASQTTGEVSVAYTYNDANLVTSLTNAMTNKAGEAVVISAFAYTYYADGYQHTKAETMLGGDPVTTTYVYDGLGRLTAETRGEDSIAYTYDASSNRIGMNQNGTVTTYAYDANNRLLSETVGDTVTAYTYDANGNTLTAGDKTFTYNARGQLSDFANETVSVSYTYNTNGLRTMKTVGGSIKYFDYNGMNIVYEYTEGASDDVAYFYGLNRTHNSKGEIYVYNAHGDVVQLVCDNAVVASYTYDAFGNLTSQIGESDNPFLYCGEYFDAETQTYYLRARYYNPANGRFTQQDAWAFMDASDPLSLNLYAYCCNNPVMYVDPSGHAVTEWDKTHLDEKELNLLQRMTDLWFGASNEDRDIFRRVAEQIRAPHRSTNEYTDACGETHFYSVSKGIPPNEQDGYIAPKGGPKKGRTNDHKTGWQDAYGNIWVPIPDGHPQAHGGGHWDVERKDGKGYVNRYPGGKERAGKGVPPQLPESTKAFSDGDFALGVSIALTIALLWDLTKETFRFAYEYGGAFGF